MKGFAIASMMVAGVAFCSHAALAAALDKPFPSVALEDRCDALLAFVKEFVPDKIPGAEVGALSCGEGNGLGGARYNVDFSIKKGPAAFPLRLDLREPEEGAGWDVRLCDREVHPERCLSPAEAAGDEALKKGIKGIETMPADATAWIKDPVGAGAKKIFGLDYDAFVSRLVKVGDRWPLGGDKGTADVGLKLNASPGKARKGTVTTLGKPSDEFLQCFRCKDAACVDREVNFEFKDRFFMLTRTIVEKGQTDSYATVHGGGWLIEGPDPMPREGGKRWSFVCGITRYSLQKAMLPAAGQRK